MFKSVDIDTAVKHIKNIVDSIRCAVCDKGSGTRMRYACGHTCCEDCAKVSADCSVCLTPLSASKYPTADQPHSQRTQNVVNLLNDFQNEFQIDVYKRHRISEQLKIEKELFPKCIQAPAKYINKRKSYSTSNKENRLSQLPGEDIFGQKMEELNSNVENWLDKYVRKPFTDLNSNAERLNIGSSAIKKTHKNIADIENATTQRFTRKRSHIKTVLTDIKNQTLIDKHLTPVKKREHQKKAKIENKSKVKSNTSKYFKMANISKAADENESGVIIDHEAVIVIDDSQNVCVDKDMNAWLAVQEAENKNEYDSASVINSKLTELLPEIDVAKVTDDKIVLTTNVPFLLKDNLSKKCIDCNEACKNKSKSRILESARDVSITVEDGSFTTIIKVTNVENNLGVGNSKQSVEVQTEISDPMLEKIKEENLKISLNHDKIFPTDPTQQSCIFQSQDMFKDDRITYLNNVEKSKINSKSANKTDNVIIEESDSDEELEESISLEVTADIHRSCEEIDYGILADVDNLNEHRKRPRRAARGYTPTSTDSSNKENFNPNRRKKAPTSKKKTMKK